MSGVQKTINQDAVLREGVLEEPKVGEVGRRSGGKGSERGSRSAGGWKSERWRVRRVEVWVVKGISDKSCKY